MNWTRDQLLFLNFLFFTFSIGYIIHLNNLFDFNPESKANKDPFFLKERVFVIIHGAVLDPGFYQMPFGSQLKDLIKEAGGFKKQAFKRYKNVFLDHCQVYYIQYTRSKKKKKTKKP